MGRAPPRVSVVMPVRDGARHLAEAVESILAQSLTALELIAVDDGSGDRTPEMLRAFAARDARVRVLTQAPTGISQALNWGIEASRAALIARMDADDIALPHRLERQAEAFGADDETVVLGAACGLIDEAGGARGELRYPLDPTGVREELKRRNPLVHSSVMMRRDSVVAVGGYRPAFLMCEDYDLWLRLSERGAVRNLDEIVLLHRERPGQSAWRDPEQRIVSVLAARACARLRAEGQAEPPLPSGVVDRPFLQACGMTRGEIALALADAALEAAIAAQNRGYRSSAAAAARLALRQPVGLRRKLSMTRRLASAAGVARRRPASAR